MASKVMHMLEDPHDPQHHLKEQTARLSLHPHDSNDPQTLATAATEAVFITPQDAVIKTADGNRLPHIPLDEARKLNELKQRASSSQTRIDSPAQVNGQHTSIGSEPSSVAQDAGDRTITKIRSSEEISMEAPLDTLAPPSRTNPLFPPLPLYSPPSIIRNLQCTTFRVSSFFLSLGFLAVIVLGSAFTSIPLMLRHIWLRMTFRNPDARRPFFEQEQQRRKERKEEARAWRDKRKRRFSRTKSSDSADEKADDCEVYEATEGGRDPLVCDAAYYARRVGLDIEEFKVQTEDGFIITLWHVYNPKEYNPIPASRRAHHSPEIFPQDHNAGANDHSSQWKNPDAKRRYPILLVHGLLQSSGSYCVNDDGSLAFYLCKSGYDVWLGNNRCGFDPEHSLLKYTDPRMWAWNIRQMGVMDLPALISRVLSETGFEKLGLICHSQGTTQTFVALAKEQRPDLGSKISVFCALAPAVYAGPLIGKMYFKFMRVISPAMFRIFFGIHAFIPFMMTMHRILPGKLYGALGYRVFSFLFNWTDDRWDRGIRDRFFQFSPVYVSAESMRWWLGRECFARHKCILSTKEDMVREDREDAANDNHQDYENNEDDDDDDNDSEQDATSAVDKARRGRFAWYDEQVPPFALWIAGKDELVDGRRLLRRFEKGREPYVKLVHSKVIEDYEHLDVIWAMDCIEKIGVEVKEVLWKTAPDSVRNGCRIPIGCDGL
ncbi:hypothetical protein MMC25_002414 [Agyrium rufum]|nr:hypothetical protein [Agyrium rufum]